MHGVMVKCPFAANKGCKYEGFQAFLQVKIHRIEEEEESRGYAVGPAYLAIASSSCNREHLAQYSQMCRSIISAIMRDRISQIKYFRTHDGVNAFVVWFVELVLGFCPHLLVSLCITS
jgi:hypothetical protein